jgi:hypothetical protein
MKHIDGTSARQLELLEPTGAPEASPTPGPAADVTRPRSLRLLQRDVYSELARRRRRAQIRARHLIAD